MTIQFNASHIISSIRADLVRRHAESPPGPETGTLTRFELSLTSQNGEDGVIAELMRRIGPGSRWFVEFGAHSGESNCQFLADALSWSGLFMDGDPQATNGLVEKYRGKPGITVIQSMVTPENIDALLLQANVPWEPDIFSIDVDGNDFWIWDAVSACHPRIVIVEYNAHLGPEACLVQPYDESGWDQTDFFGASVRAFERLGSHLGYTLVHTDHHGVNAFFVRNDLLPLLAPLDLERIPRHAPNYGGVGGRHALHQGGKRYIDVEHLVFEPRVWPDRAG